MLRRLSPPLTGLALLLAACPPQTTTEPLDSVDGLKGGALQSPLSVPSLTVAATATTDRLEATSIATDAMTTDDLVAQTLEATTATVQTLSVTEPVASLSVTSLSASTLAAEHATVADLALARDGAERRLYGALVGATAFGAEGCSSSGSWSEANCSCAAAFAGAHVCTAEELMVFAERQPQEVPEGIDGASFHSFGAHVGPNVTMPDDSTRLAWVDNCGFWTRFVNTEGPETAARDASMAAARDVVRVIDDAGGGLKALQPDISTDCRKDAVRLVCCE